MVSTEMDEEKVAKRENGEQMRKKNGCRKRNVHR